MKLDLSGLGDISKILSTSIEGSIIIDEMIKDHPDNWLDKYINRLKYEGSEL